MSNVTLTLVLAPIGVALVVVCLRHPLKVTLPVFAALVPFGGLITLGHSRFASVSSLLGLLLALGLLLELTAGRRVSVPMSPTVPLWLLFLGTAGASTLWSLDPAGTANGFIVLGSLSVVYVLVSLSHIDREVLQRTENGLLVGGVVVTLYGLVQLFFLGGFPSDVPGLPPGGPGGRFGNDLLGPNNEAVALLLPLLIAVSRSVLHQQLRSRTAHLAMAALLLTGILMTGSRGGILAAAVSGLVLAATRRQGRRRLLIYTSVGLVVGAVVFFLHPLGIAEREVVTSSSSGRTDIWRVGLAACPEYCPFGSGWETFPLVYAQTQPTVPDAAVLSGPGGSYQPHNVILLVAIELGVPGLILLLAALGTTFVEAFRLPNMLRGPPLAALTGTYFAALFLSNLEYKSFWMALFMVALSRNLTALDGPAATRGGTGGRRALSVSPAKTGSRAPRLPHG